MVQQGAGIFTRGNHATDEDVTMARTLLSVIFPVLEEIPQSQFNAATALSGSGPAYVSWPAFFYSTFSLSTFPCRIGVLTISALSLSQSSTFT